MKTTDIQPGNLVIDYTKDGNVETRILSRVLSTDKDIVYIEDLYLISGNVDFMESSSSIHLKDIIAVLDCLTVEEAKIKYPEYFI